MHVCMCVCNYITPVFIIKHALCSPYVTVFLNRDIVEDDIYEKLDAPDLATISRPPPALPLPNPTLHEGTGGVTDVANRPPPLPPPNSSLHHEGTGMPDSSSLPPALPLRHSTPNDVVEVYDIAGGPPAPQPHSSTTYKDGVEVYDPTNVPPALPPRNITPQPDASTQGVLRYQTLACNSHRIIHVCVYTYTVEPF